MSTDSPWVWAKDESGHRHLCSWDDLKDPNFVDSEDAAKCVDHDDRLRSREQVPSNDPEGRLRFTKSVSLN